MEKERLEHLSIVLEVIAFFFVTIDLYGKERLQKLRNKIAGYTTKELFNKFIQANVLAQIVNVFGRMFTGHSALIPIESSISSWVSSNLPNLFGWRRTFVEFTLTILAFAIFIGILLLIIYLLIKLLVFISERYSYEGVMVIIGAVLFLIAKSLAYVAVG